MTTSAWDDAFHDLRLHAIRHRGMLTTLAELPGPIRDSRSPGWPRTRGSDVLAIAAVVDPILRAIAPEAGGHAIDQQWRSCASDLVMFALETPGHEYTQNRAFWGTLGRVAAYLATIDAPVPDTLWRALFAEIAGHRHHGVGRVVHDDYLGVKANSYDQLWQAQKDRLAHVRGAELHEPTGDMRGSAIAIPHTMLTDVLHLAGFWSDALAGIEHKPLAVSRAAAKVLGLGSIMRRWQTAVAEVNAYAEFGDPEAEFPDNHAFWRAAGALAKTLAVLDEAPAAPTDRRAGHRNAYPGEGANELLWDKQHDDYVTAHGFDLREPPAGRTGRPMKIPRTLNGEVLALAAYWDGAWQRLEASRAAGGFPTEHGLDALKARWQAVMKDVDAIAKPGKVDDVYPKNHEFWREAFQLAETFDLFKELPTKFDIGIGVAKELPERLGDVVGGAVSEVSRLVGKVAEEAGKGLLSGFGKPLLIGGGVALGLLLLFHGGDRKVA
jgi:hypothetical protein